MVYKTMCGTILLKHFHILISQIQIQYSHYKNH